MKKLLILLVVLPVLLFSQTRKQRKALAAQKKADQQVISNLKNHTQFFTDKKTVDPSKRDGLILEYISNQFKTIGIQPKGTNGYVQQFKIDDGKNIDPKSYLKVNGTLLAVKKDYFPFAFSASKTVTGMPAMALREKGVPWVAVVKDWTEESIKNDSDLNKIILKEADRAASKGATALFLYNSSDHPDGLRFNKRDKTPSLSIPVIYINSSAYKKYFSDQSQVLDIELSIALRKATKDANDIVGFIDNKAPSNVLIATPYTMSEADDNENAQIKTSTPADIIVGTSMLIELTKMLRNSKAKNNNYTFVFYSGDDTLSHESKWLNSSAIISGANYILNLNKVGKYNEDKKLMISTYGTSPEWIETMKPIADSNLELSFDSSGLAALSSFNYKLQVPVVNFFTAFNRNDVAGVDSGQINYEGELHIARFIYRLIELTDGKGKLAFSGNNKNQSDISAKKP